MDIEWDSPEGRRRVIGVHESGKLIVETEGAKFHSLVAQDKIDAEILFDQRRLESKKNMKALVTEQAAKVASEKAEREDLDGFDVGMSPLKRARAIEVLQVQVFHNQVEFISRRDLVRKAVRHGAYAGVKDGKPAIIYPDGAFLFFPKIAVEYASYLTSINNA